MKIEELNRKISACLSRNPHKVKEALLLEQYKELNTEFKTTQRNELLNIMLLKLLIKKVIPAGIDRALHLIISEIIDEFMFDELEFALWIIYIEKVSWKRVEGCNEEILTFAALKAKSELDDPEPYFAYLSQKIANFKLKFQKWTQKNKSIFGASMTDINNKFKELTAIAGLEKDLDAMNFTFFSENIMKSDELIFEDKTESSEIKLNTSNNYIKINDKIEEWADAITFGRSSSIEGSTTSSEENDSELLFKSSPISYLDWEYSIMRKENF